MRDQVDLIYRAGDVTRFHTVATVRPQTLGHHHWHVAMLGYILYGQSEPGITLPFLMACLTHDIAEEKYGDMPAPTKRELDDHFGGFREAFGLLEQAHLANHSLDWEKFLTEEEKRRLKLCDALEGLFYCVGERAMGNQQIRAAYQNFKRYVGELLDDAAKLEDQAPEANEWKLFYYACELWETTDARR